MRTKKSILIVEDDKDLLDVLESKFEKSGFQVWTATNGQAGLSAARSIIPSVIVLDLALPIIGGIKVLEKLREDQRTKNIPVFLLTNLSDSESISRSLELGAESYIIKSDRQLGSIVATVEASLNH
jgi:DNA-binding response OmpR family regulator